MTTINPVRRSVRLALLACGASVLSGTLNVASAQEQAQTEAEGNIYTDIIVTANRRAENLQDVAVAVSAVNQAVIEQKFSRDLLDLGSIAPNLIVDPILGNGTAAISIRGIQLNDVEKSFDPPVGVFLDGVYLASTTGALLAVYDASTIEVLRGPQGTLFGRNTIGGLIHVQRNKPTGELGGKLSVTYGRFEQFDIKGVLNLPALGDDLIKAKIAFVRLDGGGYFFNPVRSRDEGDNDLFMVSPMIQITPSPTVSFTIAYDYINDQSDTRPVTATTSAGELFGGLGGLGRPPTDSRYHRRPLTTLDQEAFLKTHSVTVNGDWQFADNHSLVGVFNYRDTKENAIQEFDGVTAVLFNTERPQQIDQLSAELRYQGEIGPVKIVAGLYYFESDYNINQRTYFFGGEVGGTDYQQSAKSYAGFAQVDWEVVENFTVTLGGRYLKDEKEACGGLGQGPRSARTYLVSYGVCDATRRNAPGFSNDLEDAAGNVIGQADGSASWNKFTPKVGLSYKFEDALIFGSYSEGFRSGGFNGRGNDPFTLGPYNPEEVKNWEIGLKSEWFDKRLILNLTAFHTKYSNKQEDVVFPDPRGATVTIVQNAASAKLKGFEVEARVFPVEGFNVGLNIGYLDSKYENWTDLAQFVDGPFGPTGVNSALCYNPADGSPRATVPACFGVIDKSDFKLRRAPKWTLQIDANYEYDLGNDNSILFAVDYSYKDDYTINGNTINRTTPNPGNIDGFGLLNASISYKSEHFKLSVFGRNLTGEDYFMHFLDVGTTYGRTVASEQPVPTSALWSFGTINPPTTYGVELEIKF